MQMNQLVRWLGMICLVAGIARIGMTPTSIIWGTDSVQELTFGYIACILMSVGSIALFAVQSKETGMLGFISTIGIILGNIITTALVFTAFFPGMQEVATDSLVTMISRMVSMLGLTGGTLLYAIITFRAKVFPRWVAILHFVMILSMFLPIADNKYFAFFWGLAYVGAGVCIWTGKLANNSSSSTSLPADHSIRM
ncbi:hypothetical protein FHS18_000873 [Paenibacillus phyllosphaerae]|uniref:Uncharacterized protein n=1 Tax=Paenibacillus phyllosphaerae TaxID=274593 RepID=A0A7W5FL55_9BACL|nr:hypothetical protein [Paenibacillus phyllosphaerae]MBB3108821.1 hypothetical protein [Paenibacillus phyllosphaerae]